MARKTKTEIHADALRKFNASQGPLRDERMMCLQDRRFYSIAGAMWEGPLEQQFENKPKLEVNKIHLAVIRIFNEFRNNQISATFVPKDGAKNDKLADACNGLFRASEQDSMAEEAYDNAFEEGVGGGIGAWRLRSEYEDEEDEDNTKQRICIEPIFDADSCVFFDINAKRYDKADAKYCFVLTAMPREEYKEEYDDDPASWPKAIHQTEFDWLTPDVVYIAEYYLVDYKTELIHYFRGLELMDGEAEEIKVSDEDLTEEKQRELDATGYHEVRQKKVKRKTIHKYLMSGSKILEDCGIIAGKNIPIVPFYGKRWFIDNVERCMGHVRLAKDVQRLKNMQLSKLAEISALSSVEKPIFTPEQMLGHGVMWAEDNIKNFSYLLINPTYDQQGNPVAIGPIAYTKAPSIPQAMAALLQTTEQDIQDILGNQQAGEQLQANMSGIAVELIQNKLDMQTYIYISNMAKSKKRSGEIWLSMAKDIIVEENRKMKSVGYNGEVSSIEMMKPIVDEDGNQTYENDLSEADFDVNTDIGPTSSSKRSAVVRRLTDMLPAVINDPETSQVIVATIMENTEGEGLSDIREYFRNKLLRMGAAKPTKEEAQQLAAEQANAQPDANTQFLQASAEQAGAQAAKARADTILVVAKAEETKAKTAETLAGIDRDDREQFIKTMETIQQSQTP